MVFESNATDFGWMIRVERGVIVEIASLGSSLRVVFHGECALQGMRATWCRRRGLGYSSSLAKVDLKSRAS